MAKTQASSGTYDPQSLLTKPLDDVQPPAKLPLGAYIAVAVKYEFDKTKPSDKDKEPTNVVKVTPRLIEAMPDVDADELKAVLDQQGKGLNELEQRTIDFFLTPNALYRIKEWGNEHCKIGEDEANNTAELLEIACDGQHQFGVMVEAVPNKREPDKPYHQITRTFALD